VLPQFEEAAVEIELSHGGPGSVSVCLDFDRPLERATEPSLGDGCGEPGELLETFDSGDLGDNWRPYGITMTPEGRLFVAELLGGVLETYELTADLTFLRRFPHPVVVQLAPSPSTEGVTYDANHNTLWWTNAEVDGLVLRRVLLLEGTLDGVATGRRIELPLPPGVPPNLTGYPRGASYDVTTGRFHYIDRRAAALWAIDTTGAVVSSYPVPFESYPPASFAVGNITNTLVEAGADPVGVRIEVPVAPHSLGRWDRVVVADRFGNDLGLGETPMDEVLLINGDADVDGGGFRSVIDPNGVMYVSFISFGLTGIAAVRPVPLPPSWLTLSDWIGTIPAGGTSELTLTFTAGQRAPGEYRSTLVVEDTAGVVLASVPLTLVVEPATPANEPDAGEAGVSLTVSPNPVAGDGVVNLTLARPAADVRVTVHDVLGRVVETLHATSLQVGTTRLPLDVAGLPAGVFVVRALVDGAAVSQRITILR
jgi:hypothetical protein